MKAKKIVLAMLVVVSVLALSLFAVSCNKKDGDGDNVSGSATQSAAQSAGASQSTSATQYKYRVESYCQAIDGDAYVLERAVTKTAAAGSSVTADVVAPEGFTKVTKDESVESGVLDKDNSLVLKVYYDRNEYTLSLSSEKDSTLTGEGTYRYKSSVSVSATTVAGYVFKGWYDGEKLVSDSRSFSYQIAKNASLTAKWEASDATQYVVEYYLQNVNDDEYTKEEADFTGVTGEIATAEIKTFEHFHHVDNAESVESGVIAGDNSLVLKVYYDRDEYTVILNGGDNAVETTGAGKYRYGKEITVNVTSVGGFDFVAWKEGDEKVSDDHQFTLTVKRDIALTAEWKQTVFIGSVSQPQSLTEYYSNRSLKPDNLRNEFAFNDNPYYVGDDNAFSMMPIITFVDEDEDPVDQPTGWGVDSWNYNVKLTLKNELGNFVDVEEEDYIESIDKNNCAIDFKSEAIGEVFNIYIYPAGLASWQIDELNDYSTNFEITVIDGYNVTNAQELIYINNISDGKIADYVSGYNDWNAGADWNKYAEDNGIDLSASHAAVILHNDIKVTASDVPAHFFYDKNVDTDILSTDVDYDRIQGSLKDYLDIYYRKLADGERFVVEGNYFTLNFGEFPLVVRSIDGAKPEGEKFESHSQVFRFITENEESTGTMQLRNINLVGNAEKSADTQKAGGLIMIKTTYSSFSAINNISNQWYINYFPDQTTNRIDISYCRAYDSFNCITYLWGASDVHVDHCDFNGSGGPVFIVDHIHQNDANELYSGLASSLTITNSTMHSFVTGNEAWFQMYNASSVAAQLGALSAAFNPFGKTYTVTNKNNPSIVYLDIIAVYKSSAEAGISQPMNVTGYFNMNGAACPMDFGTYNLPNVTDPALAAQMQVTAGTIGAAKSNGTVAFVSSASTREVVEYGGNYMAKGVGVFGGEYLVDGFMQQITDPSNSLFSGDQLYLYPALGLSVVVGYYPAGYSVDPTDIGAFITTR